MKKIALILCMLFLALSMLVSCVAQKPNEGDNADNGGNSSDTDDTDNGSADNNDEGSHKHSYTDGKCSCGADDPDYEAPIEGYKYIKFTTEELKLISDNFDFEIPFIPTHEYDISLEDGDGEVCLCYYTVGNTKQDFDDYLSELEFDFDETDVDEYGDTWYCYSIGETYFDIVYYIDD